MRERLVEIVAKNLAKPRYSLGGLLVGVRIIIYFNFKVYLFRCHSGLGVVFDNAG